VIKSLPTVLYRNSGFFIGYLAFFFFLLTFYVLTSKSGGFLLINSHHNQEMDDFFILITNAGNGLFILAVITWMIIRQKQIWAWQTGASFLASGLIVQLFKHIIYSPRPKAFFQSAASIHVIQGITCTGSSSFPSGHTTSIFALATLLAIYAREKKWGIFFLLVAILTGFSRIYLSQHFPLDILVGSLIGVLSSLFIYCLLPVWFFKNKKGTSSLQPQSINLH